MNTLFIKGHNGRYRPATTNEVQETHAEYLKRGVVGECMSCPATTKRFVQDSLALYTHEVFACLFLDTRNRVISFDVMFHGTIDGASVHPREVVRRAIEHNAAGLMVAHNHPSGIAEPSNSDRAITRRLQDAVSLVDVRLLDHIVVSRNEAVSFAERGIL